MIMPDNTVDLFQQTITLHRLLLWKVHPPVRQMVREVYAVARNVEVACQWDQELATPAACGCPAGAENPPNPSTRVSAFVMGWVIRVGR